MTSRKIKFLNLAAVFFMLCTSSFAEVFFSGFAGLKTDFGSSSNSSFDPELKFQSFFSGQFSFSENIFAHAEFSLATNDLIENSIFDETPGTFKIDELSIIFRRQLFDATNYLSFFCGTYEPIGSDIFLRRQFGIQPIASKITEGWLGLSGSVIYPTFGVGGSDIIHFNAQPLAFGLYIYVNHELDDSYCFNSDLRFAGVYRFFTFDFAGGIGMPLKRNENQDAFVIIDTLYWRAGINMLLGNSYTTSLFMQAGVSDIEFTKDDSYPKIDENAAYLLFEPRFRTEKFQLHLTVFSLPQDTVDDFIFINDTFGTNINVFTDNLYIKNKMFVFGINGALSFPEKNFTDLVKHTGDLFKDDYNILIAPYISTNFYNGTIHGMLQAKITDMIDGNFGSALKLNIGYKTQF
jgi:hypothetical protein